MGILLFQVTTQKQKYHQWQNTLESPSNSIDPASVTQDLFLGSEDQANANIQFIGANKVEDDYAVGDYPNAATGKTVNGPEQGWPVKVGFFSNAKSGPVAVATYTNLHHSYYLDPADNNKKKLISKAVITYSNLERYQQNTGDSKLLIYKNLSVGAAIGNAKSITISNIQFYDQKGKLITITPGTAWLEFGSLNRWNSDNVRHVEQVSVGGTSKLYQLATSKGSKPLAVLHPDGKIYNDGTDSAADTKAAWARGDDGIAIVQYNPGGSVTLSYDQTGRFGEFSKNSKNNWAGDGAQSADWYQFALSTFLSFTDNPSPTTKVHYHYDKSEQMSAKPNFKD